jgi:UPF0755 protein
MAKKRKKRIIFTLIGLFLIGSLVGFFGVYHVMFAPNVQKDGFLYIPTGSGFQQVQDSLKEHDFLKNSTTFNFWQRQKSYQNHVKPGRYELRKGMTNRQLVNILRSGRQTPVNVTFNNIRTLNQLAQRVSTQIEADSASLMNAILDPEFLKKSGVSRYEVKAIFIPNTYELWWTTSATQFAERMRIEHDKFWSDERRSKAKARNLTPIQVSILASIVQEESKKNDEKPLVASVYLNRLRIGMPLQADPTVKYGIGDFEMRRILHVHLKHDSPFNTYRNKGLPPGPICFPSIISLDAVLNAPKTDYLFFCARPDFSGYHAFARTHAEHVQNAKRYHEFLNKNRIR